MGELENVNKEIAVERGKIEVLNRRIEELEANIRKNEGKEMELNEKIRILNKELEENRKRIITMESANKREKDILQREIEYKIKSNIETVEREKNRIMGEDKLED